MDTQEISYVIIGTKQPDLEDVKKKDLNNYLPLWKQEVRDEKGRKRLHGAFKGGFSAGYFNTVGSKEGWTPTQFVSSRSNRQKVSYRPEDFMDEEDLEDFNESKRLTATANYDAKAGQEEVMARKQAILNSEENRNSIFGGLTEKILDDIIIPNTEPVGIKLLKSMGWREGQGIGARVHRKDTEDIYAEKYLFAPKDVAMVSFDQKTNLFGLGFDPYKNAPEFRDNSYTQSQQKKSEPSQKKTLGFGVGIFEEEDDDIYGSNSMDNFNDTIMDTMDDYEERIVLGGGLSTTKNHRYSTYDDYEREELNNNVKEKLQMCSDGTYPISGFIVSSTIEKIGKWFNPPVVPKSFIPYHKFKDVPQENQTPEIPTDGTRVSLTADQRRDILGEEKLKGPAKTFMSSLSNSDQYKLQNLIDDITRKREDASKNIVIEIPDLKKEVALAALKGYMPFQNMPSKQARYKRFLEVKAGIEKDYLEFPEIYTNKEKNLEYKEFGKAAQIYQPLSNAMASRFTSASSTSDASKGDGSSNKKKEEEVITIVRTVVDWQPSRLLCKRFNIANPHKDRMDLEEGDGKPDHVEDILGEKTIQRLLQERDRDDGYKRVNAILEKGEEKGKVEEEEKGKEKIQEGTTTTDTATTNLYAEDEPTTMNEADKEKMKERPSMDLFNSIFNDDSDDEDDEDDSEDDEKENKNKMKLPSNTEIITTATSINNNTLADNKNNKDNDTTDPSKSSMAVTDTTTAITTEPPESKIKDIGEAFQIIKAAKEKKSRKHSSSSSKHHHESRHKKKKRKHHHASSSSESDTDTASESEEEAMDNDKRRSRKSRKSKSKKRKHHHHHHKKSSRKRHKNDTSSSSSESGEEEVEWVEKNQPFIESGSTSPSNRKAKRNRPTAIDFM